MSKLKIAMLAAHSCPVGELGAKDTGGMSVYIREVGRELSKQGHSVDVYTRVHDPADPIIDDLGEGARLIHVKAGQEAKIHKLEVYSYLPEFTQNLETFQESYGLSYDVVFSHYWLSGLVGQALQQRWNVPNVIMFHTMGAVKNAIGIGEEDPVLRVEAEKRLVDSCQRVIAATDRGKLELERFYDAKPDKISVVPCGVNMSLFHPIERNSARTRLGLKNEKVALFVGRLDPLKGGERLLEAMPEIDAKLIIIGGDESSRGEIEKLRDLSSALGIQAKIDFRGAVKQEELPFYYSAADVCAVPSYYESFGLVALEALSCGTPVVAADVGDLKNIIIPGKTGYIVDNNSSDLLHGALYNVLKWQERDMSTAKMIRSSVSDYRWSGIAERISRVLNSAHREWFSSRRLTGMMD
ncbi:MAG TPA: glycosyltransferase [Dehalococcoidales bacterium]|nr:glycosyltransferase [Dehalococcoidales bacterium]